MKNKKFGMDHKCRRTNKDSARFARAFEDASCRNPNMSLANIVFRVMDGEGGRSYKTDYEFAVDLDAFRNKKPSSVADLLLAYGFPKDREKKGRTMDQNAAFAKMLKHVLKHNSDATIGQILAEVVMGGHYCSYHKDEDLIRIMERF
jgi:hypothetical protein